MIDHKNEISKDRSDAQNKVNTLAVGLIALNSAAMTASFSGAEKFGSQFIVIILLFLLSTIFACMIRAVPILSSLRLYNERKIRIDKLATLDIDPWSDPNYELQYRAEHENDQQAQSDLKAQGYDYLISIVNNASKELKRCIAILGISFLLFLSGITVASITVHFDLNKIEASTNVENEHTKE